MIVSDSSTLIVLFDLERMELLSNLFSKIVIPPSVYREITARSRITLPEFITVQAPTDTSLITLMSHLLDAGESEAIALALECEGRLIIDERKGRRIAQEQGLQIIGLLGIVYLNVQQGYITADEAKTFIIDARKHGYRISQKLVNQMMAAL